MADDHNENVQETEAEVNEAETPEPDASSEVEETTSEAPAEEPAVEEVEAPLAVSAKPKVCSPAYFKNSESNSASVIPSASLIASASLRPCA